MFGRTVSVAGRVGSRTMHVPNRPVTVAHVRPFVQGAFVGLFGWLLGTGQYRLWMVVIAFGLAGTAVAGRWYCGWACPINAAYRAIDRLYEAIGVERRPTPSIVRRSWLRWAIAAGFVGLFVANRTLELDLVPILYVAAAGIAVGLVFEPRTFHRHLCPFGALFSLVSRRQRFGLEVDEDGCLACERCENACPTDAIAVAGSGSASIDTDECVTCFACHDACPNGAVGYE